jgi:N6-adenosine-specific RNA methylase IME4
MKGVKCSWVDMKAIRQALAAGERGDQKRLERMRCVHQSTISAWKAVCDLLEAIDGKHGISHVSTFQPSHALEITRAFRRRHGKADKWDESTKDEIADWVDRCEGEQLTVEQLRTLLRDETLRATAESPPAGGCNVLHLETLKDKDYRFGTIYADPPWKYDNQATRAAASNHYDTMTVEDIAALPVGDLSAKEAHLHLWTTNAFLEQSFSIIRAWGFTFKGTFIWKKPEMGLGNYWRNNHEIMMTAVRGSLPFADHSLLSCAEYPRGEHSSKPEQVRLGIMKASPGPYLELFARMSYPGWTVWGNQIEPADIFKTPTLEAV